MFEIGSSLREARMRHGHELPEVEAATKIRTKYLKALEDEQFDLLPAQTYIKGFLRAYADFLGLDGQLYVDEYNSRFGGEEADEPIVRRRETRRQSRAHRRVESRVLVLALVGIVAATVLVLIAWRWGGADTSAIPNLDSRELAAPRREAARPTCVAPAASPWVSLQLIGIRGGSHVTVYRGAAARTLLFDGTIPAGVARCFSGERLWFQAAAPENLEARLDGRRRALPPSQGPLTATANKRGIAPADRRA